MYRFEARGQLAGDFQGYGHWKRACAANLRRHRLPLQQFHGVEQGSGTLGAGPRAEVEDAADIGMVDAAGDADLIAEALLRRFSSPDMDSIEQQHV